MIKALWYLIKIFLIVGVAVILATQSGQVEMTWNGYSIRAQLGLVAFSAFMLFLLTILLTGIFTRLSLWPRELVRSHRERRRAKGYKAMLQSLTFAATGDQPRAYAQAVRAQKLLPEDEQGLSLLLQAQSLSREGTHSDLQQPYQLLLKNADTALLGLQGLTQNAILAGDFAKALQLAQEAVKANPKNYNLLKTRYDLELRNQCWSDALLTLDRAQKYKVIDKGLALRDRQILFLILGDLAKAGNRPEEMKKLYKNAYKINENFVPAVTRLAETYLIEGARHKALSLVQKCWKHTGHSDLIALWEKLVPAQKSGQNHTKFRWFQWVSDFHPDNLAGLVALASAAIDEEMWGEARAALAKAEKIEPVAAIYHAWVRLEEKTSNRPDVIRQWLDRAYAAPKGEGWVCNRTGRRYQNWVGVTEPDGLFGTLVFKEDEQVSISPKPDDLLLSKIA